jgi:quinol monooxygenase YgiN
MKVMSTLFTLGLMILLIACTNKQPDSTEQGNTPPAADTLSKKMITARIFLKPEYVAQFLEAAKAMIDSSNAEPGCEGYMLYQNPYDPTQLIFVETWKDQAAIDVHFSMSYFKAFGPKTQDWLAQPTELRILDVIPVK